MANENNDYSLANLLRPLSLESYTYFTTSERFVNLPRTQKDRLKFVRIGELIIVGLQAEFGLEKNQLFHRDLLNQYEDNPDYQELAGEIEEGDSKFVKGRTFSDAGMIWVKPEESIVIIRSDSVDFGRADEVGRAKTAEVAQKLLGNTVSVSLGR